MAWRIEFDTGALRDLRRLERPVTQRALRYLRESLAVAHDPRSFGFPLRRTTGTGVEPLWRHRVGGWAHHSAH